MSVVAIGDNVVDCYLDTGWMYPGGNCVNVAVHAARSGVRSAYVGAIGSDFPGDVLRSALAAEKVDITRLRTVDGPNSFATVRVIDGERQFGPGDRGVRDFTPSADDLDFIAGFRMAHSSYCSGLEEHLERIATSAELSFDFDDRLETDYSASLLPFVTVATFSASGLTEAEAKDAARAAASRGPKFVLLTRGPEGAVLFDGSDMHVQAAVPTDVVDTLGAGDAFIGRVLAGLISGEPVPELLRAAAAASSETCRLSGGFGYGAEMPAGYP